METAQISTTFVTQRASTFDLGQNRASIQRSDAGPTPESGWRPLRVYVCLQQLACRTSPGIFVSITEKGLISSRRATGEKAQWPELRESDETERLPKPQRTAGHREAMVDSLCGNAEAELRPILARGDCGCGIAPGHGAGHLAPPPAWGRAC